jgi:hypothetical protein
MTVLFFNDLGNYPWAKPAIESLTKKGIINGMGGSRFAPGEPLTRAQFANDDGSGFWEKHLQKHQLHRLVM